MITMQEFFQAYRFLRSMLSDLDEYTRIEVVELLDDFKVDYYDYEHNGAPQPEWDEYADALDAVLADGGYMTLFSDFKTEEAV